jgi:hypothetical protein
MKTVTGAAVWVSYFLTPSKLTRAICGWAVISMSACMTWPPGIGTGAGRFGAGSIPVTRISSTVFAAAPVKMTGTPLGIMAVGNRKAPPPYVKTRGLILQSPSHEKPSSCCTLPPIVSPLPKYCNGGTTGIAAGMEIVDGGSVGGGCWAACTRVDVWMPESSKDMQQAPTINDPKASVIFLITPPSEGNSNCAEWAYHETP